MGLGRVYLIGAGPGRPDLITVRGLRAIEEADVLICDALLPRNFLQELGLATAGKRIEWRGDGDSRLGQEAVNALMAEAASNGSVVARLKNGDPFVFGRGYEELMLLAERGIPCEVIPGISAATGVTGLAGAPVTFRDHGRSFAVVTARQSGGAVNERFPKADSLVVFMAVTALDHVADALLQQGWEEDTPAALIENGALPWERRFVGTLGDIAPQARRENLRSPALLLVGEAARRLAEGDGRRRILFTGLDATNFRCLGDLIHWPALEIVPDETGVAALPGVLNDIRSSAFDWMVFTSRVGVRSFLAALDDHGADARTLAGARIVAAGAGTAAALREHGIRADVIPTDGGSGGILHGMEGGTGAALLIQGSHAPAGLSEELRARGFRVTQLSLHRVQSHCELGRPLPDHDIVYFVSPSGVRAFHSAYGAEAFRKEIWGIGEVTLAAVRELGFEGKAVSPHE